MEAEVQGSSPSNSIDHIGMDSLESDSDEEEHVAEMSHADGIAYTDMISHADMIPHADMTSHVNGMPHIDMISYPYVLPS
jgi:hypothetical protein